MSSAVIWWKEMSPSEQQPKPWKDFASFNINFPSCNSTRRFHSQVSQDHGRFPILKFFNQNDIPGRNARTDVVRDCLVYLRAQYQC